MADAPTWSREGSRSPLVLLRAACRELIGQTIQRLERRSIAASGDGGWALH
ncbi:MAG: hypothetical protein F6K00_15040 [Leptolyngbya sp. SIOISBB]|nr:hypothetical protein [Leptolyngbya sp. SIOISBB]